MNTSSTFLFRSLSLNEEFYIVIIYKTDELFRGEKELFKLRKEFNLLK